MRLRVACLSALLGVCPAAAETRRFTLDDLDRIVRLEEAQISLEEHLR